MYQKIADALGLHTKEVRLVKPNRQFRFAVGIQYSPEARMPDIEKDILPRISRFSDFIAFQTLYVILNEEDSQELFVDSEQGLLFKLDNAASFNVGEMDIAYLFYYSEEESIAYFKRKLSYTEYNKYSILLRLITEKYGEAGRNMCLSAFEKFAELDETRFEDDFDAIGEVYSIVLSEYYWAFVISRKSLCKRYLQII